MRRKNNLPTQHIDMINWSASGSDLELTLQAELPETVANGCGDVLRR